MRRSNTPKDVRRKLGRIFRDAISIRTAFRGGDKRPEQFESLIDGISTASKLISATRLERADSIGTCLRTIGTGLSICRTELNESTYQRYFDLIVSHTASPVGQIAAYAIWALGDIGIPPDQTREKLVLLVNEKPRFEPGKTGTCRGVAFRMLAKADITTAGEFRQTPACLEFIQQLTDNRNRISRESPDSHLIQEIDAELLPWTKSE